MAGWAVGVAEPGPEGAAVTRRSPGDPGPPSPAAGRGDHRRVSSRPAVVSRRRSPPAAAGQWVVARAEAGGVGARGHEPAARAQETGAGGTTRGSGRLGGAGAGVRGPRGASRWHELVAR